MWISFRFHTRVGFFYPDSIYPTSIMSRSSAHFVIFYLWITNGSWRESSSISRLCVCVSVRSAFICSRHKSCTCSYSVVSSLFLFSWLPACRDIPPFEAIFHLWQPYSPAILASRSGMTRYDGIFLFNSFFVFGLCICRGPNSWL